MSHDNKDVLSALVNELEKNEEYNKNLKDLYDKANNMSVDDRAQKMLECITDLYKFRSLLDIITEKLSNVYDFIQNTSNDRDRVKEEYNNLLDQMKKIYPDYVEPEEKPITHEYKSKADKAISLWNKF